MKFHWFGFMPWPHLPEDFREKHHSVWVDVDSTLYDPVKGHKLYNDYLDLLEFAADEGFDGLGVNEHHQNAYGLMPSPQIMAAALARRTRDVSLLLLGQSIALYNPPTRVAEEMAMLDVISGGRLIAGFPVGSSMDANYAMGANPATLREKYAEAHDLVVKSWAEPKVFAWNGKYFKLRYVNVWPRPVQRPRPPIWIPGGGSVETWDFCAKRDYNYSFLSYSGYLRAQQVMDAFWHRLEEMKVAFNPYQGAFAQLIAVANSDAEAEELYAPHVRYFFERCLHIWPGFVGRARLPLRGDDPRGLGNGLRRAPIFVELRAEVELARIDRRGVHHRGRRGQRGGADGAPRPGAQSGPRGLPHPVW